MSTLYRQERIRQWDRVAVRRDERKSWGGYYHQRLEEVYGHLVSAGQRVLEIGCGEGTLLASLNPSYGVGVDFSEEMISRARAKHPELTFMHEAAEDMHLENTFDIVILSDIINDLEDVQLVLEAARSMMNPRTRIIINFYSQLWEYPLRFAEYLDRADRRLQQNWLTVEDVENLLSLSGFDVVRKWEEIILPLGIPLVTGAFNRFLARLWPFRHFSLTHFMVARPAPALGKVPPDASVSVVVPARNEAGNIENIVQRMPEMGSGTEIIFVEGLSTDNTCEAIEKVIEQNPGRNCRLFRQKGRGKGDAVREGFAHATGDILMILDADLTVPPEMLPRFYQALVSGKGEFVNGVRLVYPMDERAMRFLNFLGNKFFSLAFSWLLGQPVKDCLCGTKVLSRRDYQRIAENRSYFGEFDPFGDFDLIFGAARLNLKHMDLPIRYRERTYGSTNINRWQHGWMLLKMVVFAAGRIKFV